jgi:hypothetical protein
MFVQGFHATYCSKTDEELLLLPFQRYKLIVEAQAALVTELARRGIGVDSCVNQQSKDLVR